MWIHNDKVELRDASHLVGKGAMETQDLIREELDEPRAQVAAIGPAGENRVFVASIEQSRSSSSRLGGGAVMGDKKIKAIVPCGAPRTSHVRRGQVHGADATRSPNTSTTATINPIPDVMTILAGHRLPGRRWCTPTRSGTPRTSPGATRGTRRKDFWTDEIDEGVDQDPDRDAIARLISCYNCPQHCGALIAYRQRAPLHDEMLLQAHLRHGRLRGQPGLRLPDRPEGPEYGVDGFSTPQILAFAVELKEAGILTDEDFEGMPRGQRGPVLLAAGPPGAPQGQDRRHPGQRHLLGRQGPGATEAEEAFAHNTIKKHEQLPIKLGMLDPLYFLMYATNEKISITQIEGQLAPGRLPQAGSSGRLRGGLAPAPGREVGRSGCWSGSRGEKANSLLPHAGDRAREIVDWMEMLHNIDDALGICAGMGSFCLKPPYHIHNYPKLITALTGMDAGREKPAEDRQPQPEPAPGLQQPAGHVPQGREARPRTTGSKRFPELEKELLDTYYKFKGWNEDGIPTKEFGCMNWTWTTLPTN